MFLGSAWFKLEMGNSRGKSRLAGLSGNCQPGAAVVRLLTRLLRITLTVLCRSSSTVTSCCTLTSGWRTCWTGADVLRWTRAV